MKKKLYKCRHIRVDCANNDPIDILSGDPNFCGFDFYLEEDKVEELTEFISETLKKYNVPLIAINVLDIIYKEYSEIWPKEKIEEHICKKAEHIKHMSRMFGPKVKCNHISVDCVKNDPVDVRSGGPDYLGFDFYVAEEETEEMKKFITATLKKYKIPLSGMFSFKSSDKSAENVWSKEKIEECIKKDANYLIKESKRNY